MDFIAYDFETANAKRDSACSLALVVVRDNQIVDEFYTLLNPQTPFSPYNVKIHQITPKMVQAAPTMADIWSLIENFFQPDQLVIAHNAPFDNSVLKFTLAKYQIAIPEFLTLDTVRTSRAFWPELANHKLNTVANKLALELEHHQALSDARACANILIAQAQEFSTSEIAKFIKQYKN